MTSWSPIESVAAEKQLNRNDVRSMTFDDFFSSGNPLIEKISEDCQLFIILDCGSIKAYHWPIATYEQRPRVGWELIA